MELLAQACEAGALPVSSVAALAGSDRRADGREALEIAGFPMASDALGAWNARLVEATGTLQSLLESARSLWPKARELLTALARASEVGVGDWKSGAPGVAGSACERSFGDAFGAGGLPAAGAKLAYFAGFP